MYSDSVQGTCTYYKCCTVYMYYVDNNNQLRKSGTTLFQNSEQPPLLWYISSLPSAIKLYIMQRYIVHVDLCKYSGPLNKIEQKWTVKKSLKWLFRFTSSQR